MDMLLAHLKFGLLSIIILAYAFNAKMAKNNNEIINLICSLMTKLIQRVFVREKCLFFKFLQSCLYQIVFAKNYIFSFLNDDIRLYADTNKFLTVG